MPDTIRLDASQPAEEYSKQITGNHPGVAVRMPAHPGKAGPHPEVSLGLPVNEAARCPVPKVSYSEREQKP